MIVVFGLIANQMDRVNWSGLRDQIGDDSDFPNIFGESYNFNDNLEQAFPADASLKVIDNHGAVSVHASDDNKITVVVRKRVSAESQDDADKYDRESKPVITAIGGLVTVDAKTDAAGDHSIETDLDISVPRKAPVSIAAHHGDVNVSGRSGNVDISAQHSDTSVDDITGNVKVSQEKGSLKVEQVTGDVHLDGRVNEVSVSDIKGSVQLDGEFQESIKLERIAKTVTFKSSRTDMELSRISGSLDLDSDDLHAEDVTGPLHLTTRSKNIRLDGVSGDVRLQDDNGTVEVVMHVLGNVQIDNRNGDVQIGMKIVRIRVERSIDPREFHVGARRLESDALGDAGYFHTLLEFAIQLDSALHVGYREFVDAAVDVDVSGDLLDLYRSFFLADFHVARDIFNAKCPSVAPRSLRCPHARTVDISMREAITIAALCGERDVEVGFDGMISGCVGLRVHGNQPADGGNRRLGLAVVLVGILLIFSTHTLANNYGDPVVLGGMHAHGAVIVDDLQARASGEVLFDVIVKVVGFAKDIGEVAVVDVELVPKARPVHALQSGWRSGRRP